MTKLMRWLPALAALVVSPAVSLAQGTFFFKQSKLESVSVEGLLEHQSSWLYRTDKPDGLKGVPTAEQGRRGYFYAGTVGDHQVVAHVRSGQTRELYIDLDGNNDLSDEKPVTAKRVPSPYRWGWSRSYCFGPLTFTGAGARSREAASGGAGSTDFYAEQIDLEYLLVRPTVCQRGTVRVGDHSYPAVLLDANLNGRYDDAYKFKLGRDVNRETNADMLAIDVNRNGRFDYQQYSVSEVQPLTQLVQLDDKYYSVQAAPDGSRVTLDLDRPELGKLDIGKQIADLVVQGENGMFQLSATGEPFPVPVGRYRLLYVTLKATDEKKIRWSLRGRGPEKKPIEFEVKPGGATSLKLGPPLVMEVTEHKARSLLSGRSVSFTAACHDGLGIEYEVGAERGSRLGMSSAPSVKILNELGQTVSVGKFEYG